MMHYKATNRIKHLISISMIPGVSPEPHWSKWIEHGNCVKFTQATTFKGM